MWSELWLGDASWSWSDYATRITGASGGSSCTEIRERWHKDLDITRELRVCVCLFPWEIEETLHILRDAFKNNAMSRFNLDINVQNAVTRRPWIKSVFDVTIIKTVSVLLCTLVYSFQGSWEQEVATVQFCLSVSSRVCDAEVRSSLAGLLVLFADDNSVSSCSCMCVCVFGVVVVVVLHNIFSLMELRDE